MLSVYAIIVALRSGSCVYTMICHFLELTWGKK